MLRRLTKDAGRFKAGVLHDWPLTVWHSVAKDAGFKSLEDFSTPQEMNAVLQNRNRGADVPRERAAAGGRVPRRAAA